MQNNNSGFWAQDFEIIYPNLAYHDKNKDIKEINYLGLIPELTKAIQELSIEVEKLKIENDYLKSNCCNPENANSINADIAKLYQNSPNPFNVYTRIDYYVPNSTIKTDIYIYNLNGMQLKHLSLS